MSVKFVAATVIALAAAGFAFHATSEVTNEMTAAAGDVVAAAEVYNAAPAGYNDPDTLAAEITTQATSLVADPNGAYYLPGVTVTQAVCIPTGERLFDCRVQYSQPEMNATITYLVSEDGLTFIPKG